MLSTDRLILRQFTLGDIDAIVAMFDDEDARRFFPVMTLRDQARAWVQRNRERYETTGVGLWAICLENDGKVIGDCGLAYQNVEGKAELEIGYHLRSDMRGRGLVTEAAQACMRYGFECKRADRLISLVHPANLASQRVAERIHRHVRPVIRLGEPYDVYYTNRGDWLAGYRTT